MANQVGAATHASLLAAQMLHLRDSNPEAWTQTSRVASASVFLCSIMIGKLSSFTEAEAAGTGLYSAANEKWDEGVLKIIAGFEQEVERVKIMLGGIERNGAKPVGRISSYFSTKYGLDAGTRILTIHLSVLIPSRYCGLPVHVRTSCVIFVACSKLRRLRRRVWCYRHSPYTVDQGRALALLHHYSASRSRYCCRKEEVYLDGYGQVLAVLIPFFVDSMLNIF